MATLKMLEERAIIDPNITKWVDAFIHNLNVNIFPKLKKNTPVASNNWPSSHRVWGAFLPTQGHISAVEQYCDDNNIPCYHVAEKIMTFSYSYSHLFNYETYR